MLEVVPSAYEALLRSLGPADTLVVTHRFEGHETGTRHRLDIDLYRPPAATPGPQQDELLRALQALLPRWRFDTGAAQPSDSESLPLQLVLEPAPLLLTRRSGGRWAEVVADQRLPFPADLANWPLTVPFEEPIADGHWALQLRFERVALPAEEVERIYRVWQELRRGSWRLHHPGAQTDPYVHDAELEARAQALVRAWLGATWGGYHLSLALRGAAPFSAWAVRRLSRDVFGPHLPVQTVDTTADQRIRWPLLVQQGLPGWVPTDALAIAAGLPAVPPEPARLPEGPGVVIGHTSSGAKPILLPDALLSSHLAVLGASGSGKSSCLERLALERIHGGAGVAVFDPHSELTAKILAGVPAHRRQDVVVIDLADDDWSVALNPMQGTREDAALRNFVAGQLVELQDRVFETHDSSGPASRMRLDMTARLAMAHPNGGTLQDCVRLLVEPDFMLWLLDKTEDPQVAKFFADFRRGSGEQDWANWRPYLASRYLRLVSNRALKRLFCRPSTVDLASALQGNRILLFNLSASVLSQAEIQAAGTLLLMMFHLAARRCNVAGRRLERPYSLILDEAQNYMSTALVSACREARKLGLGIVFCTQSVHALRHPVAGDLSADLLGNTACKLTFRTSPRDALRLEEFNAPEFPVKDIVRLPNYHAVLSIPALGMPPLMLKAALPRAAAPGEGLDAAALRAMSGRAFGTPVAEADAFLLQRHGLAHLD